MGRPLSRCRSLQSLVLNAVRLMLDYVRVLELHRPRNLADSDEPSSLIGRLQVNF